MKTLVTASSLALSLALFSAPALAYIGPGAGLGVIGTLVGIVAAIVLAMFGLFWYPLKRAFGKKPAAANSSGEGTLEPASRVPETPVESGAARATERPDGDEPPK